MTGFSDRFPALARPGRWGNVTLAPFVLDDAVPPLSRVQSVNVVPFVGGGGLCVVIGFGDGSATLPGGTIERSESLLGAARREVREEAGAVIHALSPIGHWPCHSGDPGPWRSHLPHPDFLRVVFRGEVSIVGPPGNPAGAEQITRVEVLPLAEATSWLRSAGRADLADLYRLAGETPAAGIDLSLVDQVSAAG